MIKSHVLYRLSYALTFRLCRWRVEAGQVQHAQEMDTEFSIPQKKPGHERKTNTGLVAPGVIHY